VYSSNEARKKKEFRLENRKKQQNVMSEEKERKGRIRGMDSRQGRCLFLFRKSELKGERVTHPRTPALSSSSLSELAGKGAKKDMIRKKPVCSALKKRRKKKPEEGGGEKWFTGFTSSPHQVRKGGECWK